MNIIAVITKQNLNTQLKILRKYSHSVNVVELRLDSFYPINYEQINKLFINLKSKIINLKSIITFRHFSEGGKVKVNDQERKNIISNLIFQNHKLIDYIDIEFSSSIRDDIISLGQKYNKKIIVSKHFLTKNYTENFKKLQKILLPMFSLTREEHIIVKLVTNVDKFENYLAQLRYVYSLLLRKCLTTNTIIHNLKSTTIRNRHLNVGYVYNTFKNFTFFTIGKTALISRLISCILKMPLIYVTPLKPVIPTQPNLKTLLENLKKLGLIANI